jgi:hypothetical protein
MIAIAGTSVFPDEAGRSQDEPVIVPLPSSPMSTICGDETSEFDDDLAETGVDSRTQRWIEDNEIRDQIWGKRKRSTGTVPLTDSILALFKPASYLQERRKLMQEQIYDLESTSKFLGITLKTFKFVYNTEDRERMHFISPVVMLVACLFGGKVKYYFEHRLEGKFLQGHTYFDYILRYKRKAVCILYAKDSMEKSVVQALLRCEIVADAYDFNTVYTVVTTYSEWAYIESLRNVVRIEYGRGLAQYSSAPVFYQLKEIAEMMYAMLYDESRGYHDLE